MGTTTMTRRAALTGAASASIIMAAGGAAAMIPTTRDEVERHWQDRCAAFRELETDEHFLDNQSVQEPYWRRIDAAEIAILASTFRTRRTAELQLWIAWSHYRPSSTMIENLVKQGSYASLVMLRADLDWNERMMFAAITTLRGGGMTMNMLTRRAAFTGAIASIAVVGATAATAASTSPAAAGVSPELSAFMAAYDAAGLAYEQYGADVVEPLEADAAIHAAALPHTAMRIDCRDHSTANSDSVNLAFVLTRDNTARETHIYFWRQWRSLLAAHKHRERAKHRILRSPAIVAALKRQDDLSSVWADAMGDVCHFPASTPADLHAKLAFMVQHKMFEGVNWGDVLLADAARLKKMEG